MALYPNGRYLTRSPGRHFGSSVGLEVYARARGDRINRLLGESHAKTASTPDGYGMQAMCPPLTAGSMTALRPVVQTAGAGDLLSGGPMEGAAQLATLQGEGGLSLVVGLSATALVLGINGNGATLSLTIGLDGVASVTVNGVAALSMTVPVDGSASLCSLAAGADLRGILRMAGEWTPYTDLSPQSMAQAVLAALLAGPATPANVQQINSAPVVGTGQSGDMWRGA